MKRTFLSAALLSNLFLGACGDPQLGASSSGGMAGSGGAAGAGGMAGAGGAPSTADPLLDALRTDLDKALFDQSTKTGWPAPVEGGYLFVTTDPTLDKIAGDHANWDPTDLTQDKGFAWIVLPVPAGTQYKFTNLTDYVADPWARSYTYDDFGEMSLVQPTTAHLDRYFRVGDAKMQPRTVRILVPDAPATHVLYTHDGQNLFDPSAFFGGWKIQDTVPPAMMVVGIDNTPARIDEYTHITDVIDSGQPIGGLGDAYADFLQNTVRPLIAKRYGEPKVIGTMGSSLGGLISFHIADRLPDQYAFAASLSGTMGWGSIGLGIYNETMIERYAAHGHRSTVLYLDSGGGGDGPCEDTDMDGIADDISQGDNYCENAQMRDVLLSAGYKEGTDLTYVWAPDAQHNEAEWAARVSVPMQIFAGL